MPRGTKNGWVVIKPALIRFSHGIVCIVLHVVFVMVLGFNVYFCGTEEFLTYGNLFTRMFFCYIAMTGQRFMYYTPWCISDASQIASGLAYNAKDKDAWNKIVNVKIIELETSTTCIEMIRHWNH